MLVVRPSFRPGQLLYSCTEGSKEESGNVLLATRERRACFEASSGLRTSKWRAIVYGIKKNCEIVVSVKIETLPCEACRKLDRTRLLSCSSLPQLLSQLPAGLPTSRDYLHFYGVFACPFVSFCYIAWASSLLCRLGPRHVSLCWSLCF